MEKVFSALSDVNRRKIIELLHEQDSTLLELAGHFSISFQALSKHIKILEQAQIINKEVKGKYRQLSLNGHALREAMEWMAYYSSFWNESFDKLEVQIRNAQSDDHRN
ncbi:MAG: winged helix-turn-helix transcriptional regulator [Saprospiraceae bacterium]|nr:winged helix-turn-helix transcriptional regulator [Saprospiraceae bacterium]